MAGGYLEVYLGDNLIYDNDTFCNHSIKHELRPLLVVMCSSATVSAVLTLIAVGAMIFFRLVKLLTHRLILNKLVSLLVYCTLMAAQSVALWRNYWKGEHYNECVAEGFVLEYIAWVTLLSTFMMTVHLTSLVLLPTHYMKMTKLGPFYLIFPWTFPLLVAWIPFIHNNFGMTTWWCWIKQYQIIGQHCSSSKEGWIEIYTLWYGELSIGLILNNIGLLVVAISLCKRACCTTNDMMLPGYRKALKQTLPLVIYPVTFQLLSLFAVANRIYQVIHHGHHHKWISYAEAVSNPSRGFFAPVLTMIYFFSLGKLIKENIKKWKKCCPKIKDRKNDHCCPIQSHKEVATGCHLIDPEDRLTSYGTVTVTSPTGYDWGRESEIERQYEIIN